MNTDKLDEIRKNLASWDAYYPSDADLIQPAMRRAIEHVRYLLSLLGPTSPTGDRCAKCGHFKNDPNRRGSDEFSTFCIYGCGCECIFATKENMMNPQCTDTVREYVNSYELCGDDGDYTPNEREQLMIEDAIHGYIAEHATPASTPLPTAPTETWSPIVESACECACHADRPYCPNCNQHCMEKRQSTVPNCHKFIRLHGGNCPVHGAVSKEEAAGERKITDSLDMALRSCVPMSRQSHIRGLINEALLTARATAACSCVERIEAISKVAATTVALMLNRSHCTGEPVHGLAHALLGNASDLGDIVNEFVKVVAPELEPEIITALSKD